MVMGGCRSGSGSGQPWGEWWGTTWLLPPGSVMVRLRLLRALGVLWLMV